jgi:electron transport complex protein RnfE
MKDSKSLRNLIADNPSMLLLLGICPALAATADVRAALGMSLAVLAILVVSALILTILGKFIPTRAGIPAVFLVTAGVASVVELLMHALFPSVYQLLGIYVAVLAVDLLVFACGDNALRLKVDKALGESLMLGLQFMIVLLAVAVVREVLGAASFAGVEITAMKKYCIPVLAQGSGGFMLLGITAAILNRTAGKPSTACWFSSWVNSLDEKSEEEEEESAS